MKKFFVIFALITFAISQKIDNGAPPVCTFNFNGTTYSLTSTWYQYQSDFESWWIFNPCDSPNSINIDNGEKIEEMKAGAYFNQGENSYNRGYANDAVWNMEIAGSIISPIFITMIKENGTEANPACLEGKYETHLYFFCEDTDEAFVALIGESDCAAYFEIFSNDACIESPRHRRVFILSVPLLGAIACASFICCCICSRRRRQTKILKSNFSNVAFQPIPSANVASNSKMNNAKAPTQPVNTPYFVRPNNYIQVPRTYFFSEPQQPNQNHVVQLEEFHKENQIANDERLARELQNQLN